MAVADIIAGLLIGGALGVINVLVLRFGVRFAVKCPQRAKAALVIITSYAIRYLLIAVVVYVILKQGSMTMVITTLGVLGMFTILWALIQRGRTCGGGGTGTC